MELEHKPVKGGFRLRGESISRLETFVDAAFAFALSMLVISVGGVPKDVGELLLALHRIPTFAASFLLILVFWLAHNRWSRRFGMDDGATTALSLALVFTMLVFVYPLRMVISGGLSFMTGGFLPSEMRVNAMPDLQGCFVVYGLGFTLLSLFIVQLNRLALRRARELELDELEILCAREEVLAFAFLAASGVISVAIALCLWHSELHVLGGLPGFVYAGLSVTQPLHHRRFHARKLALAREGRVVRGGRALTPEDLG